MSLPAANKEISAHPGANSVTDPVNRDLMQADIDRKLRLYGAIEAFRQGRLPDNKQIDESLRYILDNSPIDESGLSPDGHKLINDTRDIIETARLLVQQKNGDELIQNFIYRTNDVNVSQHAPEGTDVPVTAESAKRDGEQAARHLRTLAQIVLTNSEARKLLSDVSLIGRDLFARGAAHAATLARPDPEDLARVDDAAPSDEWKRHDGETLGPEHPAPAPIDVEGTQATVQRNVDTATDEAAGTANEVAQHVDNDNPEAVKRTLKDRILGVRDRVPEEHRQRVNEHYTKAKDSLKEEFPQERRDQFIYRLKKVIVECQKHNDYQNSIQWFIDTLSTYFGHSRTLAATGQSSAASFTNDPTLQRAITELRTLLERFANGRSLDGIINAVQQLAEDSRNDEQLRLWFEEMEAYVKRCLLEPGYVLAPACNSQGQKLIDTGRVFFEEKYKGHKDRFFDEVQAWFLAWSEDPLNKRFGQDWNRLTKDLLFDDQGGLTFKPHLWADIRKVIVPQLVDKIGYIPIPRIEYTDNQIDLVVENITLAGRNLFPNIISLEAHNFVQFSPYSTIKDEDNHDFKFTFAHMQADMRDVAFYFNKKTGLPKMKDSGIVDLLLGGAGLTVYVHLKSAGKDPRSVFYVENVSAKVDSLKFSVRDSSHDLLYKTVKPLIMGLVKKQISKAIQDSVRTGLEYIDEQLVQVRDRMNEAKVSDDTTRTQALADLFKRKSDEATTTASRKSSSRDSTFKLVAKRDSVILPEGHESGWINRQAERADAAQDGEGWHSKAFSIVPTTGNTGASNTAARVAQTAH
ncbi:hypothetical protein BOTBODRAFT_155126 [Botryobasidium botryosum FD-172 SS1]|uniref:Uncharacterized protein n=1 Tax=Botryobasidium botryosum (strain FD-172 SS1) TaxID=930990 RepID=A0A067N2S4_BOTB1|nr:hypothetical protein BOTBODRAFT_155126 [Botryobasidium botryosum FD-172 SS1]